MMNEMNPETGGSAKQNKAKVRKKRTPPRASQSRGPHSRKR
jgi:hypothetical protein